MISCFKESRNMVAKIRNFFSAWWTMSIFVRLFMKLILKRPESRGRPRIASRMKVVRSDLLADQWDLFLLLVPFHLTFRAVSFDQLRQTYFDEAKALLEGGVDLLILETIFDTLNGKAALFAITDALEKTGHSVPLMISGTVIDKSGRNLSGQTVEALLISLAHAQPLILGLNCSLGPDEMEPFVEELARISPYYMSAYPNAGLPDALSPTGFPETAETFAPKVAKWAENGWLNLVGGCCGTTPDHIRALAKLARQFLPRVAGTVISYA